ncbi:HAMP domain-containing histidine kinase [Crossiella sp. SN42]|uniref:HAMP domain-containing sensor histidine kinase n=1 Tax=Crossiella sp. SN42 TaxID=2944808 RepID=UPI00207CA09E|nr:HAMP domain-containing sensor histidine kinase [Crossiella sp. SN42]MCO1578366.1 HAMP domain-containing histidine kinase [Crossiella sp. SN42]
MTEVPTVRVGRDRGPQHPRMQRVTLRNRLTLFAAVGVGTAVALVSLAAYFTVRTSLYNELDEQLLNRAKVAAESSLAQVIELQRQSPAVFEAIDLRLGVVQLLSDGRTQLFIPPNAPAVPYGPDEIDVAAGLKRDNIRTDNRTDQRVVAAPIDPGFALVIAQPLHPTRDTLARLAWVLFAVGGAGIVLAAAGGLGVARTALRPVERLTKAAEHVARTGDLQPIPVTSEDDELARLTNSFNAMLAALADSQERQRRLVADAGHELRTPLTSLRTNLELLVASQQAGAKYRLSDEDRAEIYADVRAQIEELTTLIGDLVELARDDAPFVVHESVELVDVVERALDRARRRAPGVSLDIRLRPWTLVGDANALERAVMNLLDNAVKWSPPDGRVRVELRQAGAQAAVLEVADSGPGIAEDDLPHVFERFYRSTEARTLPGSGLGLAIVKQVAERHGGTVTAGRAAEGGALMSLWLPGNPSETFHTDEYPAATQS